MQISRMYSNLDHVFTPIDFNCGYRSNILNLIFAEIRHPENRSMDSHNLGKTLLIHLIDFLFLKQIASSEHFLERHKDRFASFTFFMEIALNAGDYVTVRRSVENNTRIAFKRHEEQAQDLVGAADEEWDHRDLPLERAVELLDAYLDLSVLKPWNYRKGISYFLRTQDDYRDVLQIQKFVRGRDADWKPFVAHLFGLDHHAVERKYELDGTIESWPNTGKFGKRKCRPPSTI